MNLTWYKNIEPLLKIDNIYHLDHVSVHKILNPKQYPKQDKPKSNKLYSEIFEKTLAGYNKMNPLPSKKFRVQDIFKNLRKNSMNVGNMTKNPLQNFHFTIHVN